MIFTIAWRELRTLFLSPLAWVMFVVVQTVLAILFLGHLREYMDKYLPVYSLAENALGMTEYIVPPLFWFAVIVFLIIVPLLTMRLIAEERRNKTLPLLFSAPISATEIVIGKFLGVMGFLLVMLAFIGLMPLSLAVGGTIDYGLLASVLLGFGFMLADFAAVGLFMSSLTQYPAVAAIATFGTLLLLWLLDPSGQGIATGSWLAQYSLANHYIPFLQGVLDSTHVLYHLLLITTFLVLAVRRLNADRLGA